MSDTNKNDIDLGSAPGTDFDPFADDDDLLEEVASEATAEPTSQEPEPVPQPETAAATSENPSLTATKEDTPAAADPLGSAVDAAETKDAENAKVSLNKKPPVFEYAGAKEDIQDTAVTFDELRIAKAADFPELDDGKRVTWSIEYGKITKEITDIKGTTIAKAKSDIESSKAFIDALKKAKDKNLVCKVKPRVKAQSKGTASGYKGVFPNMEAVEAAGKVISVLPAKDGNVYEVRKTPLGTFTTTVVGSDLLSDVKAGFIPAFGIPRIPMSLIMKIIAFFRYYTIQGGDNEVLVNIYWDSHGEEFVVDAPSQTVSKVSVHSEENPDYLDERYIHYMDIHSHNSMRAFFSPTDDKDEKATRLYSVIGRLDSYFPEIKTRISNGGKFLEIDPAEVFEYIASPFPPEWKDNVKLRAAHGDIGKTTKGADMLCMPHFPLGIFDKK